MSKKTKHLKKYLAKCRKPRKIPRENFKLLQNFIQGPYAKDTDHIARYILRHIAEGGLTKPESIEIAKLYFRKFEPGFNFVDAQSSTGKD